jgi:hypothetical protein
MKHLILLSSVNLEDYMLPCFTKQYFGIDCFGCGIQRSLALIFRGDLIAAFKMYPAIYTLVLFFGFLGVNLFYNFNFAPKLIRNLAIINGIIITISFINKYIN